MCSPAATARKSRLPVLEGGERNVELAICRAPRLRVLRRGPGRPQAASSKRARLSRPRLGSLRGGAGCGLRLAPPHLNPQHCRRVLDTLCQVGEQIPILSDGIVFAQRWNGNTDAAERAGCRSLKELFGKDGALTKVMELLPGTNLLAAAVHEAYGHKEEAHRALAILRSWKQVGSADGPLLRLAELLHGVDVLAFAIHLLNNNYPQALRSITKTKRVDLKLQSLELMLNCKSFGELSLCSLKLHKVQMEPRGKCIVGGVVDLAVHLLQRDKHGELRRSPTVNLEEANEALPKLIGPAADEDGTPEGSAEEKSRKATALIQKAINEAISSAIKQLVHDMPEHLEAALQQGRDWLTEQRAQSCLKRALLPKTLPPLGRTINRVVQESVPAVTGRYGTITPPSEVRSRSTSKGHPVGAPECAAGLSCFAFTGCCVFGLHTGPLACLAGVAAGVAHAGRRVASQLPGWLNKQNEAAWVGATGAKRRTPMKHPWNPPVEEPLPAATGLTAELGREDVENLSELVHWYLHKRVFKNKRKGTFLSLLEPPLRAFVARAFDKEQGPKLPIVIHIEVPPIPVEGLPFQLRLPPLQLALCLEVSLAGQGPYITGLRVSATDAQIARYLASLHKQVSTWDLREADPRLAGFTEPVNMSFSFKNEWAHKDQLDLEIQNFKMTFHLPQ